MRLLNGKLKGKKLATCNVQSIRPAMALVRKSIFDSLGSFVQDADILDLCAGTGILGIEALSRGAKSLTVVDSSRYAIKLILKNLNLCGLKAKVIQDELPKTLNKKFFEDKKYDLIFLDPPYGNEDFVKETLLIIAKKSLLKEDGFILIETEKRADYEIPEEYKLKNEKIYGNTKVRFLKGV